VLVWEIFTLEEKPYDKEIYKSQIKEYVESGRQLLKPSKYCPQEVWQMVKEKCFALNPLERVSFQQLAETVESFVRSRNVRQLNSKIVLGMELLSRSQIEREQEVLCGYGYDDDDLP